MKIATVFLFLFLFHLTACSQTVRSICTLPTSLAENSGMLVSSADKVWLHNDSGQQPELYLVDTFGVILDTILVQNVPNIDWEDITKDDQGNVYIGDFGNNLNSRQNLQIYKIPHPDSIVGDTVSAEIIRFYYPEQTAFPPADAEKKYDTEAIIFYQDSLYVFTKDRTDPHLAQTWMYQIPADTGTHAAVLLDSFHTQQISYIFEVTAAAISPNGSQLALLGANRIWLFWDFVGHRFFDGTSAIVSLQSTTQKEGLDFIDEQHLYFSNETSFLGAAQIGEVFVDTSLLGTSVDQTNAVFEGIRIFPNPTEGHLKLEFALKKACDLKISLFGMDGKRIKVLQDKKRLTGFQQMNFELGDLPTGCYIVQLKGEGHRIAKRVWIR